MYLRLIYYTDIYQDFKPMTDEIVSLHRVQYNQDKCVGIEDLKYKAVEFYMSSNAKSFYEMIIQAMIENKPILNVDVTKMQLAGDKPDILSFGRAFSGTPGPGT